MNRLRYAKNRRRPGGPTDPEVSVLRFEGAAGTKAVLVNYACHPVVLGPDNLLITADYPSYLRQTLSAIYPCALVVFATGADGNINTGHQARASIDGRLGKKRTFAEAQRLGRILAGEALKALETATEIDNPSLKVKGTTVALPLEKIPSAGEYERMKLEWEEKYRSLKAAGGSFGEIEEAQLMADWAEKMKQKWSGRSEEPKILCELTVFTLGDCEFYTLPGEFFFEFGLMLKEARRPRPLFVLGYTNGCIGYVAPEAAYKEGGYEIDDSYRYYGLPARLLKGGGEQVVQALLALVTRPSPTATTGSPILPAISTPLLPPSLNCVITLPPAGQIQASSSPAGAASAGLGSGLTSAAGAGAGTTAGFAWLGFCA